MHRNTSFKKKNFGCLISAKVSAEQFIGEWFPCLSLDAGSSRKVHFTAVDSFSVLQDGEDAFDPLEDDALYYDWYPGDGRRLEELHLEQRWPKWPKTDPLPKMIESN